MEMAEQAVGLQHLAREVGRVRLEFLHTHHVCVLSRKPGEKTLVGGGADAVEVGGYNAQNLLACFSMENFREAFIEFALLRKVLLFGEFKTKAGRESPYFFNAGLFNDGASLGRLARFYVKAIEASQIGFDMLFGPAYKGIPLVAALAVRLSDAGRNVPFAFNRKEAKDHGEGGSVIGAPLKGRVLIVDDVISAGTSVRESVELIRAHGATPCGVVIALDRQERGPAGLSAVEEVERHYGMPVIAIATLADLIAVLEREPGERTNLERVLAYQQRYGVISTDKT
jgi:orotate phosphoribosyltransferase